MLAPVKLLGRQVSWSESSLQRRALEQVTDLGVAFDSVQDQMIGLAETAVPAIYRARQFLSDTVSSLHIDQVQGKVITDETPELLSTPDPELTYHDFMNELTLSLVDDGNAFLRVTRRDAIGNPSAVRVLPHHEVSVGWDSKQLYRLYSWRDQSLVNGRDIIHIPINRKAGELRGTGPMLAAANTLIATARAEENLSRTLTEDNFTPSVVIKSPEVKTVEDAERVLRQWTAGRDASGQGRKRPSVMNSNSELEQITFKPIDAQWIEGRDFTVQQFGRLFGIHGFFLLVESGSSLTYSTTESLFRLLLTSTLRPTYLERIEQAFTRLLPSGVSARFNTDEILRADITSRYQAHNTALGGGAGFKTINEVRAEEGLAAIVGGDEMVAISTQPKAATAQELAEVVQKVYLGVGKMISPEEARAIVNAAGGNLSADFTPSMNGAQ